MTTPRDVLTISAKRAQLFHFIYEHILAKFYNGGAGIFRHQLIPLIKTAVDDLALKRGDRVVVFCCGTGLEFPFIRERVGPEGEILGIDWSDGMLTGANRRITRNGWTNVRAIKGDVAALPDGVVEPASYDAGICTLGLSIMSEPERAFAALQRAVKGGGTIVIDDICSFSGRKSILNPINILLWLPFGNTRRSLMHSRIFAEALHSVLLDVQLKWRRGGSYYIASGTLPMRSG
jgi:ubiquinone/menaquinone biosynthesis C-methylase UbiE